jgi:hippurate hydrolase
MRSLQQVAPVEANAEALYWSLHEAPELSNQERNTAKSLAAQLKGFGFDVHEGIGGFGVVGVLENGPGKFVMLRTDTDALPIEEQTVAIKKSHVRTLDESSQDVPVMHACGHDLHMAAWVGAAQYLSQNRDAWKGKVMFVAQPAEEKLTGARSLIKDGLFTRFGNPDAAFAIHVHDQLPLGQIGYTMGPFAAAANNVDLTVYGRSGHGAYPQNAIDPIVIASRIVLSLQTIVSRETDPSQPLVVTVGSIHGGTKHNSIPDSVKLELTVRSYKREVQERALAAIQRIAKAEAEVAGAPRAPLMTVREGVSPAVSDPTLTQHLVDVLGRGKDGVTFVEIPKEMGSEDFAEYGAVTPTVMLQVGVVDPEKYKQAKAGGSPLPSLHSSQFLPNMPDALKYAIWTNVNAVLTLLGGR